ncbi:serine--tRNA ligase [candidate division LCP-89 bacterium B3_LCP]|uniref:Serine--tRNA ligase n=1 Tax=candidate division LCP-89 bacterium B3_LCP TaxID=2012998 RepID=A0A532UUK2_UNCL8|nr:MAG: serine--tRNA ligase [candidate division LCP-89 bacterium B3_LCP]
MLDLKFIRENKELVRQNIKNKNETAGLDRILELDEERRGILVEVEKLKATRNRVSKEVGQKLKSGANADDLKQQMREVSSQIQQFDQSLKDVETELDDLMKWVPNVAHPDTPIGDSEEFNRFYKSWGEPPQFDFDLKDHLALGGDLDILDFPRGAKITGSGFPVYKGKGAALERALINFMLDLHIKEHGYTEIMPPFMTNAESMYGTGQLPKLADDMYFVPKDDLYLIPTAEVPLTNLHRDEIIPEDNLPIKYAAYTPCFRREAGSYGRDTRGFLRVHQFNKVELVRFVKPETSYDELEKLLLEAEKVLQLLNLHYRVVELCTGDLSFASAKTYDIETWAPAEGKWLETSSISNFTDFQARRAGIRYRQQEGKKSQFLHTLNGSGVATSRLMVALLETCQTDEGTVMVPEVLHPYLDFRLIDK